MKFSPLECVDRILEKMHLQLEGILATLLAIICHCIKKLCIAPEVGRAKQKQPQNKTKKTNPKDPGKTTTFTNRYKLIFKDLLTLFAVIA